MKKLGNWIGMACAAILFAASGAAQAQTTCNSSSPCLFWENLSTGNGIRGKSDNGIGVGGDGLTFGLFGSTVNGQGVGGTSTNGTGGVFDSANSDGIQGLARGNSGSGGWFRCTGSGCWGFTSSGNGYVVGSITQTSAREAKHDIADLTVAESEGIVFGIHGRRFKWINTDIGGVVDPVTKKSDGNDTGFIADEVQKVMPWAVRFNEKVGLLGVDYSKFIPPLLTVVQNEHVKRLEAEAKVAALETKAAAFEARLAKLEAAVYP